MDTLNIVLADYQPLITKGISVVLHEKGRNVNLFEVFTDFDLSKSLTLSNIQLLIIDPEMLPDEDFVVIKGIRQTYPKLAVLILTNKISKADLNQLAKIGIKNVVYKNMDGDELIHAIDATLKGKKYYSEEVLDLLMETEPSKTVEEPGNLTPSEIDIVRLIAAGLTTKEIAVQKCISFHTVITHRKNIFRKLEINNSSELLMYAMRKGLIDMLDYQI